MRYVWIEEYHCGCVAEEMRRRDLLGYCARHGEDARCVYKVPYKKWKGAAKMNLSEMLIAFDLKKVRDAQQNLSDVWNDDKDCIPFADFEELKRILRQMEDYLEGRLRGDQDNGEAS